jgi:uncharacterized SAM-binding protein YcdF (DUF218 family)
MFLIAKLLTWLASPLAVAFVLIAVATISCARDRRRRAVWFGVAVLTWLLIWSSPLVYGWLGGALEAPYPPRRTEEMSAADAIVVLGGGITPATGPLVDPEMYAAADRVWHGARLYRAGKAPIVILSGSGEERSSRILLRDLGVPPNAIRTEGRSRNTYENALQTRALLATLGARRVLLVTSAWHMRRAHWLFSRAGVEALPAATDYEATLERTRPDRWDLLNVLPNPETFFQNSYIVKEYLGYWACRVLGSRPVGSRPETAPPAPDRRTEACAFPLSPPAATTSP